MMSSQVKTQRVLSTRRAQDLRLQLVKTEASIRCGQRIRTAREAKHLSQSALARLLPGRVDGPSVSRWERGEVMPGPANIEGLAAALGQDYAYFVVPDALETPDLMSALSNGIGDPSQLDRIELALADHGALLAEISDLHDDVRKLARTVARQSRELRALHDQGRQGQPPADEQR